MSQYLPKIEVRSAANPNFSFHQLPPSSVGFRGLPSPYIVGIQTTRYVVWGRGRKPKFMSRYLPSIVVSSSAYPNFSFRQLPSASFSFRQLPPHIHVGVCRHMRRRERWAALLP